MKSGLLAATLLAVSLWSAVTSAAAIVGQPAPTFSATDSHGAAVSLSTYRGKYVVMEWMNPSCPFTQKHYRSGNIQALQKDAIEKGVVWLTVNTSSASSFFGRSASDLNAWLEEMNAKPSALLVDSGAIIAKQYGAKTTPHMFVIDPQGSVIYAGAIDDKRSASVKDVADAHNYVKAALDAHPLHRLRGGVHPYRPR